ncbi:MAG: carboxypeptidase-like regulatory domain-containing protein [Cytophagaceae bacterium]|nr:carboxypeptidase-like regulatory domain-containing protein [Cytophagaceae bacterium]
MKIKYIAVILCVGYSFMAFSQTGTLSGKIYFEDSTAAFHAVVGLQGTSIGMATNDSGYFQIQAPIGSYTVIVQYVGYPKIEIPVEIIESKTTRLLPIYLKPESNQTSVVIEAERSPYVVDEPSESLRLTAPLIEIPQNISVVTAQTMKEFGVTGTSEMSRMTSGLIRRYGGNNDFAYTIRGSDATNSVFRNGVGNYWYNQGSDAFMLDRVEFVKGPAGFMIGNSEPGGLLNEVTKQANGRRHGEAFLGVGSWNLTRGGIDIGNRFSDSSKFSYRVVGGGQWSNNFVDMEYNYRWYICPTLRYDYGKGSSIVIEVNKMNGFMRHNNYGNISYNGSDFLFNTQFNPSEKVANGIKTYDDYYRISHTQKLGKDWQLRTQIGRVNGLYKGDALFVSSISQSADTLYRSFYEINWRNYVQTAQSFVDGKIKMGEHIEHSILTGIDYGKSWVNSQWSDLVDTNDVWGKQLPLLVTNPVKSLTEADVANMNTYPKDSWGTEWISWYGQNHMKLYNKIIVTMAGRMSFTKAWSSYDTNVVHNTKFTPRFGLTYLVNKKMSIYTLYDQTFLPQTARMLNRQSAKPLTGSNIEVGYKAQLFNNRLFLNSSLFYTVKNDVLSAEPTSGLYVQRGQVTAKGFEMDMMGNISKNILLSVNYTYTDARITKDADSSAIGFPNYGVAKHVANAMIRYKFTKTKLKGFSLGAGMQHMGDKSAVWAGWTDPADKFKAAPSYTLYDINMGFERKKYSCMINIYNLFNASYMDSAWWSSSDGTNPGFFGFSPAPPRNVRFSVFVKF